MYNVLATMMLLGHDISLKDLYKPQARRSSEFNEVSCGSPLNIMSQQREVWKLFEDFKVTAM